MSALERVRWCCTRTWNAFQQNPDYEHHPSHSHKGRRPKLPSPFHNCSCLSHPALKPMDVTTELHGVTLVRNTAFPEKSVYGDQDCTFLQHEPSYVGKDSTITEDHSAIATSDLVRPECETKLGNLNEAASRFMQIMNMAVGGSSLEAGLQLLLKSETKLAIGKDFQQTSEVEQLKEAGKANLEKEKAAPFFVQAIEVNKRCLSQRKSLQLGQETSVKIVKSKNEQEIGNSGTFIFDTATIPIPYCSCTGTNQQCYRWGKGGWQSACCTYRFSIYPLPTNPRKRGSRVPGRKMSGGAFKKLLAKFAAEGLSISCPVDLKNHWARHGTNRYVTIK